MNIASFAIKRTVLISSIVILIMSIGLISISKLGVDMFPNTDMPFISLTTVYPGASTEEMENLVTKVIEDEISSISGLKKLSSNNMDSFSLIFIEFTLETDIKFAEQQIRNKLVKIRSKLPDDIQEPIFEQWDPSKTAIARVALQADLSSVDIYDVAKEIIKPKLEQINNVGSVKIYGGTRREIQIEIDRKKLDEYQIPAIAIADQLKNGGVNIPVGKYDFGKKQTIYRSISQYETLKQIEDSLISFSGDIDKSITLKSLATVSDGMEDPNTLAYLYYPERDKNNKIISQTKSKKALFLDVYKRSGANTVSVVETIEKSIADINKQIKDSKGKPEIIKVFDSAKAIKQNIDEVKFTIILAIILAIIVVYLFLGNIRSTLITGFAIPNSLLGAFILMYIMGFTINVMTLMALSLTVGLLVDDAIVVRENIFRKLEMNMRSFKAAIVGTREVMLAVIATTLTIIAVFFPIGFLQGIVGKFFKEFGFTVVFAMIISLFDALTVAPFLSAYFAGAPKKENNFIIRNFELFQKKLEEFYGRLINYTLDHPIKIILISMFVLIISFGAIYKVKMTFMPESNTGEFLIVIEMPPGTSLNGTRDVVEKIEDKITKSVPEVQFLATTVGTEEGESNTAKILVSLVPADQRKFTSVEMKTKFRELLKEFTIAKPKVNNIDNLGWEYPFVLIVKGDDLADLENTSLKILKAIEKVPDLIDTNSSVQGKFPEFSVKLDSIKMSNIGVLPRIAGGELRYQIAGGVVGKLHQNGIEYDVRMRVKPDQRDIKKSFNEIKIPNVHGRMIPLSQISIGKDTAGSAKLIRENKKRVVHIFANLVPGGAIENAKNKTIEVINKEVKLPEGITYTFEGDSESFQDLTSNIMLAMILSVLFIYLTLASLYESFITPVTILLAIPPALSGSFLGLFIANDMLNVFSMIGIVMLIGLVTKNSILLVDFALEGVRSGMTRKQAIHKAGVLRLRPILMTSFAMIAGALPMALGIGEAAKQRSAMGSAIVGGLIVSMFITLLVVPAVFEYIDRFREYIESRFRPADIEIQKVEVFGDDHSLMQEEFMNSQENNDETEQKPEEKKDKKTKKKK